MKLSNFTGVVSIALLPVPNIYLYRVITLACAQNFFQMSEVYQVISDRHFMLISKMPFLVFGQVWFSVVLKHFTTSSTQ